MVAFVETLESPTSLAREQRHAPDPTYMFATRVYADEALHEFLRLKAQITRA